MVKVEPKTLPGFMELMPNDQVKFNEMKETIKRSYERFGFLPLDTPVIEYSDVLLAKAGGETEKQIYRFTKGDTDLALRFDLTVPLAKYVAQNQNELGFPFKRYQIGKVYRGEKAQKGRYREFYQCDIDIIGDGELSIINDAQMPSVIYTTFKELGFDNFTICINNRKILNGLFASLNLRDSAADVLRIIDKIDKIGEEAVKSEIKELGVTDNAIEAIMNFILIDGNTDEKISKLESLGINDETFKIGLNEITDVVKYIRAFGVPDEFFAIDLKIARGLDYYTGTVYETFLNDYKKLGSVCSGGRYDNLAEYYTDKKLPGVGISIGFTRLFYQLNEAGAIKTENETISDVLIVPMDENIEEALNVATKLREAGINTDVYLEDAKMKKKMKYADKWNIPNVIIIGEEERNTKLYALKNMITGEQASLSVEDIIKKLRK
ncbi:MAG: histidine--tRNA ligase [Clostridia bacterium]|nr:histidine--tRNA ligase [Clostridia bacterium]